MFGVEPKFIDEPKGSALVFERVTAGAALNGSEFGATSGNADHAPEPNGSTLFCDDDTEPRIN